VSHRSGRTPRRAPTADLRLLVLGILLTATGVAMSTCEPLYDALGSSSFVDPAPHPHDGVGP
jgi:predicted acyltransferase